MSAAIATGSEPTTARPAPAAGLGWAAAGLAAGLAGAVGIAASIGVTAVYDADIAGDAVAIAERLGEQTTPILVFHVATMISTLLLVVFAAGLKRHLEHRGRAGSLAPSVAAGGLGLVAVAGLIGSGLTTEFAFVGGGSVVPEAAVVFGHWVGTLPWLWAGAGLAALAVGVAALREAAAPRWLGWVSAALGGLITLLAVSPLQYMAGMVGPVWLAVAAAALLADARSGRSA